MADSMTKKSAIPGGKLYGGHSFETGPGKQKPHPFQQREKGMSPGSAGKSGPGKYPQGGDIGHKAKGSFASGTKGDAKGEDSAGSASGKRGNVKA